MIFGAVYNVRTYLLKETTPVQMTIQRLYKNNLKYIQMRGSLYTVAAVLLTYYLHSPPILLYDSMNTHILSILIGQS